MYSASKDCTIVKWCLKDLKKVACLKRIDKKAANSVKGHRSVVHSLSISSNGKFLASGDSDKEIHIWDPVTMKWVHTFKGIFNQLLFSSSTYVYIVYFRRL